MSDAERNKQIQLNRLRATPAKEALKERDKITSKSRELNNNNKRNLKHVEGHDEDVHNKSRRNASTSDSSQPLRRDPRLGQYYEYDLSKMQNSKGGFLIEDDHGLGEKTENEIRKEKQREMERTLAASYEPGLSIDLNANPKCKLCSSIETDRQILQTFGIIVCHKCKQAHPEKFSLLTKTECKEDYLLTDSELRDAEIMPHLLKRNPHRASWNNMMLFLREQVEDFAFKKWGGPEGLDKEWERREQLKHNKRGKKFQDSLNDLRRRTKNNVWQQRQDAQHVHDWTTQDDKQICNVCNLTVDVEHF
ncbi:DNA repair protein [Wallemia mellicola]|uniref:DNA repair protein n=1 Tax=Wallemia mellicola TaxID=1708541 RepID=A0A4T0LCI8_9BASI|nr:hypothetical protein E3Q24_04278 [Wallemia mellicola]TIB96083.1 DNA repair protein [Wallemia mellicola]TIC52976.1 DNA repair protein [Wallemia mellicola]